MAHLDNKEAFEDFKSRVLDGISEHFPVKGREQTLELEGLDVRDAALHEDDIRAQHKAKLEGKSWSAPVYAQLKLVNHKTGKVVERKKIRIADIPKPTRRYSHIVDGQEYQVDNQWQLKPGVYTRRARSGELQAKFNVPNKQNFDINFDPEDKVFHMKRGKAKKIPVYPLLKSMGVDDDTLEKQWGKDVLAANKEASKGQSTALAKFFKSDRKRPPKSHEEAENYFIDTMTQSELRPDSTEATLGKAMTYIDGETFTRATTKMLDVLQNKEKEDDRDSLVFKDLRSVGDFAHDKLTSYRTKQSIRNKMLRQINSASGVRDIVRSGTFNKPLKDTFTSNSAANVASQINPVEMISSAMQTTIMGPGGIQSSNAINAEAKLVNDSHFGFLDPIHTPESEKTGVTLHLPVGIRKVGKDAKIPAYNLKTGKVEDLSVKDFMASNVALPDQVSWENGKPKFIGKTVKMSRAGNKLKEGKASDAQYVMRHPSQMFSVTSNLIPFMGSNSGNRASYATQHIEQAISLKDREAPLVQTATGTNLEGMRSFEELLGRHTAHISPTDGHVVKVKKNGVIIQGTDGKKREVQLYNNFPLNDPKSVLDSTATVKVGDKVKKGQAVADTNFTKGGKLALGTNLNVAYLPYKGYNFEDGVVISESAAKKLSSIHMHKPAVVIDKDTVTNPTRFARQHAEAFTKKQYRNIGNDGVVKVGTRVAPGDPLVLATKPYQLRDKTGRNAIRKSSTGVHTDMSLKWDSDHHGEVVGVNRGKKGEVTVHVKTVEPMQVGDKITGRHGNKGIVTQVLADKLMPQIKGKKDKNAHIEVALNPAGVPGRMNVGQVLETAAAKIAKKTGKTYTVENFGKVDDHLAKIRAELKAHGLRDDGTEELVDPQTGVSLGRALSGPQYMLKLTHQIDKKVSARSGMPTAGAPENYDFNLMPTGGGKTGGQSMGNLGLYALLAHGAKANIREMHTWKSEGPDSAPAHKQWRSQHDAVWKQIQSNEAYPTPTSTFAFEKFTSMLKAAGVNVTKKGSRMQLTPLTDAQILKMSQGVIKKPSALTTAKIDSNGDPTPVKDGLFDPKITGGHGGKKWSHFELAEPMPNPVFEGAIKKVLGLKKKQYEDIILSDKAIDPKTGKVVALASKGSLTGGPAIAHMLSKLDTNKELKKAQAQLDSINISLEPGSLTYNKKGQPKTTQKLDAAVKKVKYLTALKNTGLSAEEAYTLKNVPVIPPAMRPASLMPDGSVKWADLNGLYAELASLNEQMKDPRYKDVLSDKVKKESRAGLYDGVKALMGVGSSYTDRQDKNKGLLLQIAGSQPKKGYFQSKLLNRRQDLTMRSTIVPEPSMGLDDVGLPTKKAMTLFRPFVVKKLQDTGAAQNPLGAQKLLDDKRAHKDPQVLRALDLVMKERPVLMKRDPVLHKHSIQAFNAHRVAGRAIKIHPLVTNGYNADFDGDQMSVYVPIHPEAVKEARNMTPSNNLFNEATGRVTNVPTLDSALGLYKLSTMKGDGKKSMANEAAAIKAVGSGKLGINERVKIKGIGTTTAGRLMISTALPEGSRLRKRVLTDSKFTLDKKGLPALYTHLAKDHRGDFGEAANKLKDLGFGAAFGAVRVPHPDHTGPEAIQAAEAPAKNIKYLPTGTHSLTLADFTPDKKTRDRIVGQTQRRVGMINRSKMTQDAKDLRAVEEWTKATKKINVAHAKSAEKNPDNLFLMLKAGVKPKAEQYQQIKLAPMLLKDSMGKTLPTPVTRSYSEGLDLAGYWTQMHGARKGSVQKVQEVREPGFFSKQLVNTTMGLQVNGRDCGTHRGVALGIGSKEVYDRELAAPIKVKKQAFPVGTQMTPDVVSQIRAADPRARVTVRSPLKCEHAKGLCQKCAGISPNGRHYDLGTNLGILSAQSLGERAMQLTLKSFHSGGVAGAGGKLLGSFERVNQLTRLPKTIPDAAVLSMKSGTVDKIEHGKTGSDVWIGGQKHFIPRDRAGRVLTDAIPALQKLDGGKKWSSLRPGQRVDAGQTLSDPNRTAVNPHDLYRATKSIEKVQNHMVNELHSIFGAEGVRRQHVETVVRAMSDATRIKSPGSSTSVLKGEYQSRAAMHAKNRQYLKAGKKPIVHEPILKGIDVIPRVVQEDWMAKLNFQRLGEAIQEGASTAAYSELHGPNPIPGMAYAAEFGMTKKHKRIHPHLKDKPEFGY